MQNEYNTQRIDNRNDILLSWLVKYTSLNKLQTKGRPPTVDSKMTYFFFSSVATDTIPSIPSRAVPQSTCHFLIVRKRWLMLGAKPNLKKPVWLRAQAERHELSWKDGKKNFTLTHTQYNKQHNETTPLLKYCVIFPSFPFFFFYFAHIDSKINKTNLLRVLQTIDFAFVFYLDALVDFCFNQKVSVNINVCWQYVLLDSIFDKWNSFYFSSSWIFLWNFCIWIMLKTMA